MLGCALSARGGCRLWADRARPDITAGQDTDDRSRDIVREMEALLGLDDFERTAYPSVLGPPRLPANCHAPSVALTA
jgi:hypothetical protein